MDFKIGRADFTRSLTRLEGLSLAVRHGCRRGILRCHHHGRTPPRPLYGITRLELACLAQVTPTLVLRAQAYPIVAGLVLHEPRVAATAVIHTLLG